MNTHMNEMQLAFPGQSLSQGDNYIAVPLTPENETLLKRRGYFYEVSSNELQVYFPNQDWLN